MPLPGWLPHHRGAWGLQYEVLLVLSRSAALSAPRGMLGFSAGWRPPPSSSGLTPSTAGPPATSRWGPQQGLEPAHRSRPRDAVPAVPAVPASPHSSSGRGSQGLPEAGVSLPLWVPHFTAIASLDQKQRRAPAPEASLSATTTRWA